MGDLAQTWEVAQRRAAWIKVLKLEDPAGEASMSQDSGWSWPVSRVGLAPRDGWVFLLRVNGGCRRAHKERRGGFLTPGWGTSLRRGSRGAFSEAYLPASFPRCFLLPVLQVPSAEQPAANWAELPAIPSDKQAARFIIQSWLRLTLCDPHGLQHAWLPCPSLSPGVT